MRKLCSHKISKLLSLIFLIVFILLFSNKAYSANLSVLPHSTNVSVGNIVSVNVSVNTEGKIINNAEASVQFPTEMLEVVSITKGSSIFTLWVEEPNFSNNLGKISFNGGVPNPGYTGVKGNILSITFRAKKEGNASIIFTDGAVRENDGLGTNILNSKNSGIIQITTKQVVEPPLKPVNNSNLPVKPTIFSETNPNQDLWYSNKIATFSWKIPSGVSSLKTLLNKISTSTPNISYDNSVTQKTINNISDGNSYFHLQYFNSNGGGEITHYKVNIDSISPKSFIPKIREEGNKNFIKLDAIDEISGIDYYNLQIDNNPILKIRKDELIKEEYILPIQNDGIHDLVVTAYDKAGNHTEAKTTFRSLIISVPILSLNPNEITTGDDVTVLGETDYPNQKVRIIIEQEGKQIYEYNENTDIDGAFSIVTDRLEKKGIVSVWAEIVFSDSVKSNPSQKVYLKVNETKIVKLTLSIFYPLLYLTIILVLLLILFIFLYLGWHKFFGLKKKIENESKDMIKEVHKAMLLLKDDLDNQLEVLEKLRIDRTLNEKEEIIFLEIKKKVDDVEKFIDKRLKK